MKFEGPDRDEIGVSGQARDLSQPSMALRNRTFFRSKREQWQADYVRHLWFTDFLVVCAAVATAQFVRFGDFASQSTLVASHSNRVGYWAVSIVIAVLWIAFLAVFHTRSPRIIGTGPEEYRRIVSVTFKLFGAVAILSLLLQTDIARGYLAIAFPLGLGALLVNRWLWRLYAVRRRQQGEYQTAVLVVGNNGAVADMSAAFMAAPGYRVVGVCTPTGLSDPSRSVEVRGEQIKVVGADDGIVDAVRLTEADTVALAATDHLSPEQIRELAWDLEELGVDLMIRPGLVDVAGPRLQTRPVDSMPMLHIEPPQYDRAKSVHKRAFDIAFSTLAMLAVLPVLIGTAIAVKVTSRGPILYRSERMGLNGEPFRMIKFRSMSTDADRHLPALMAQNEGSGLLFKMRDDPRVTQGRQVDPPVQHRRVAAVRQRAARRDERRRPAAAVAHRDGAVRRSGAATDAGQAGPHRAVADQRTLGPLMGGVGSARPLLRRELVDDPGPAHRPQDDQRGHAQRRGVLTQAY